MAIDKPNARIEFQQSVIDILKGLYPVPTDWTGNYGHVSVLKYRYADLQVAVHKYRAVLNPVEQSALDRAWLDYSEFALDERVTVYYGNPQALFKRYIQALLNIGGESFESLTVALRDWFDKPLAALPGYQRHRYEKDFFPQLWDQLTSEQRQSAAEQRDYQYDPEMEVNRNQWFDLFQRMKEVKQQIDAWKAIPATTAGELASKEVRLAELKEILSNMQTQVKSGILTENPKRESPQERKCRLEIWYQEERRLRGDRGAKSRTAKRERISRQALSQILNRLK